MATVAAVPPTPQQRVTSPPLQLPSRPRPSPLRSPALQQADQRYSKARRHLALQVGAVRRTLRPLLALRLELGSRQRI